MDLSDVTSCIMHLSRTNKLQLLLIVAEEMARLAGELKIQDTVFFELKKSLSTSEHAITLAKIIEELESCQDEIELKKLKQLFNKTYREKLGLFSTIISYSFTINVTVEELQKIIEPQCVDIGELPGSQVFSVFFSSLCNAIRQDTAYFIKSKLAEAKERLSNNLPVELEAPTALRSVIVKAAWFNNREGLYFFRSENSNLKASLKLSANGIRLKSALRQRADSSAKQYHLQFKDNEESLSHYLEDLFFTNKEKISQLLVALIRTKDNHQFALVVHLLNEASGVNHLCIADLLIDTLNDEELFELFRQLFRLETTKNWGRDTKLLYLFLHHFMLTTDNNVFKERVWANFLELIPLLTALDLQKESLIKVEIIRNVFYTALQYALNPANFPPLMQDIVYMAWLDLQLRGSSEFCLEDRLQALVGFIILRFINPTINEKSRSILSMEIKWWFKSIIPGAIKTVSLPINKLTKVDISTQELLFNDITKNQNVRQHLYTNLYGWLTQNRNSYKFQRKEVPLIKLSLAERHQHLNQLLQQEAFSGLKFKKNGLVQQGKSKTPFYDFFPKIVAEEEIKTEPEQLLIPISTKVYFESPR